MASIHVEVYNLKLLFFLETKLLRKRARRNTCNQLMIALNWMDCMNAFCVLVAQHHALPIGGTEQRINTWVQLS